MFEMETYTTSALARISGIITRDQLIQWASAGLLQPARKVRGENFECVYTREQAIGVIALGELRRTGVSNRRIRAASALLPQSLTDSSYIIFDGRLLYVKSTPADALELLTRMDSSFRVLKVRDLVERLR
jgi:DNA-binding transcriptional MerR regulator